MHGRWMQALLAGYQTHIVKPADPLELVTSHRKSRRKAGRKQPKFSTFIRTIEHGLK
jgi:hypothetical protein